MSKAKNKTETQKMELALLYEDHTWDTEIFNIPLIGTPEASATKFFYDELSKQTCYRNVVLVAVYNESAED